MSVELKLLKPISFFGKNWRRLIFGEESSGQWRVYDENRQY